MYISSFFDPTCSPWVLLKVMGITRLLLKALIFSVVSNQITFSIFTTLCADSKIRHITFIQHTVDWSSLHLNGIERGENYCICDAGRLRKSTWFVWHLEFHINRNLKLYIPAEKNFDNILFNPLCVHTDIFSLHLPLSRIPSGLTLIR